MSTSPQQDWDLDAWLEAISEQESGGKYGIQRQDKYGATGKYQVIKSNIGPWTKEVLGVELTPEEFASVPEYQEEVVRHKFNQYHRQRGGNLAEVAKDWYGRGKPAPGHPSPDQYAASVVAKYEAARKRRGGVQQQTAPKALRDMTDAELGALSDDEFNAMLGQQQAGSEPRPTTKAENGTVSPGGEWKVSNGRWTDNLGRLPSQIPDMGAIDTTTTSNPESSMAPLPEGYKPPSMDAYATPQARPKGLDELSEEEIGRLSHEEFMSRQRTQQRLDEQHLARRSTLMVPHSGNLSIQQANDSLTQFVFGGDAATARSRQEAAIRAGLLAAPLSVLTDDRGQPLADQAVFGDLVNRRSLDDGYGTKYLQVNVDRATVALKDRFNREAGTDPELWSRVQMERDPNIREILQADYNAATRQRKALDPFRQLAASRLATMSSLDQPTDPESRKQWIEAKARELRADEPLANTILNALGAGYDEDAYIGQGRPVATDPLSQLSPELGAVARIFNPAAPLLALAGDKEYQRQYRDGLQGVASFFNGLTFGAISDYDPRYDEAFANLSPAQQAKFSSRVEVAKITARAGGTTAGIALLIGGSGGAAGAVGALAKSANLVRAARAAGWIQNTIQGTGIGSSLAQATIFGLVDEAVKTGAPSLDEWARGGGWNENASAQVNIANYLSRFAKNLPDNAAQFIIGNKFGSVAEKIAADYGLKTVARELVGRGTEGVGEFVQETASQLYRGEFDADALMTAGLLGFVMGNGGGDAPIHVMSKKGIIYRLDSKGKLELVPKGSLPPDADMVPEGAILGRAAMGIDDFYVAVWGKEAKTQQRIEVEEQGLGDVEGEAAAAPAAAPSYAVDPQVHLAEAHRGLMAERASGEEPPQTLFGSDAAVRSAASDASDVEELLRRDPESYIAEQESDAEALGNVAKSARAIIEGTGGDAVLDLEGKTQEPIRDPKELRVALSRAVLDASASPDGTIDPIRHGKVRDVVEGILAKEGNAKQFLKDLEAAADTQRANAKSIRDEFGSAANQARRFDTEVKDSTAAESRISTELQAASDAQRAISKERYETRNAVRDAEDYVAVAESGVAEAEDAVTAAEEEAIRAREPLARAVEAGGVTKSGMRKLNQQVKNADAKVEQAKRGLEKAKQVVQRAKQAVSRATAVDSRKQEDLQEATDAFTAKQQEFNAAQDRTLRAKENREALIRQQKKEKAAVGISRPTVPDKDKPDAAASPAAATSSKAGTKQPSGKTPTKAGNAKAEAEGGVAVEGDAKPSTTSTEYSGPDVESKNEIQSQKPEVRKEFLSKPENVANIADRSLSLLEENGGSSVFIDGSSPTKGISVSIQMEQIVDADEDVEDAVARYLARSDVREALAEKPNRVLGAWKDNGKVYLDVSEILDDRQAAIDEGEIRAQLSIFDIGKMEEIKLPVGRIKRGIMTALDFAFSATGTHLSEQELSDAAQPLVGMVAAVAESRNISPKEAFKMMVDGGILGIKGHSVVKAGDAEVPVAFDENGNVTLSQRTITPEGFINLFLTPVAAPPKGLSKVAKDEISKKLNALVGDKIEPFDPKGPHAGREERFQEWKEKVVERFADSWMVDIRDALNMADAAPAQFKIKGLNDSAAIKEGRRKDPTREDAMALLDRGLNWYDAGKREAIANVAVHRPELRTDENGKPVDPVAYIAFATILGAHSPGNKPVSNGPQAIEHYVDWQADRDVARDPDLVPLPLVNTAAFANVEQAFEINGKTEKRGFMIPGASYSRAGHNPVIAINKLAQLKFSGNTRQAIQWLHETHPRSEVLEVARQLKSGAIELPRVDMVPGSFVLDTKIGAFIANLGGNLDFVTIDLWFSAGYNRHMGTIGSELARNEWEADAMQAGVEALGLRLEKEWRGRGRFGRLMREAFGPPRRLKPAEVQGLIWYIEQQIWAAHGNTAVESVSYEESTKEYSDNWAKHMARREQGRRDVEAAWLSDLYTTTSPDREALAGRALAKDGAGRVDPSLVFGPSPDLTGNAATVQFLIDGLEFYKNMPKLSVSQVSEGESVTWGVPRDSWVVMRDGDVTPHSVFDTQEKAKEAAQALKDYRKEFQQGVIRLAGLEAQRDFLITQIQKKTGKSRSAIEKDVKRKAAVHASLLPIRTRLYQDVEANKGVKPAKQLYKSYAAKRGTLALPEFHYAELNTNLGKTIADAYEELEHSPDDPAVQRAYKAFTAETKQQWQHIIDAGVKMEPWQKEGQPYANSKEMMADVAEGHLYFFTGGDMPASHPLAASSGITVNGVDLTYNDVFRAVHDYFGHSVEGLQFGPRGEYNATRAHAQLYGRDAMPAMLAETLGQNSWVNFGKHLRDEESGELIQRGDKRFVLPADRPFAEQKAALLPLDVLPTEFRYGTTREEQPMFGPSLKGEIQRIASIGGVPSVDALVAILAGKPEYLGNVARHLLEQRSKLFEGKMTVRDVAKAYILTLASINSTEQTTGNKDKQSLAAGLDPQMQTGSDVAGRPAADFLSTKRGEPRVRPEDFMAKFLFTEDGKVLLDHVEAVAEGREEFNEALFAPMMAVRAGFGSAQSTAGNAIAVPKENVTTLRNLKKLTEEINEAGRSGEEAPVFEALLKLKGIGQNKKGFIGHLLGLGGAATVDAVELNTWLLGKGVAGAGPEAAMTSRAQRPDLQPLTRKLVENGLTMLGRDPRIASQLSQMEMAPEAFFTIMHHWLWDRMKGTETTHKGVYDAMTLAQDQEEMGKTLGMVAYAGMGPATINYYVGATAATAAHESVHAYRRFMPKEDLAIAEEWVAKVTGIKVYRGEWRAEHDEALARGFEQWLLEGKMPDNAPEGLLGVFQRLKAAVAAAYQGHEQYETKGQVDDFRGRLDDNIRGVFERMLGLKTEFGTPSQQAALEAYKRRAEQGRADSQRTYAAPQPTDEKFALDMMLTYCRWDFRRMPIVDQRGLLEEIFEVKRDNVSPRTTAEVLEPAFAGRVSEFKASKVPELGRAALQRRLAKRLSDGGIMSPQFDADAREILEIYRFGQHAFNALYPNKAVARRNSSFALYLAYYHPKMLLNVTRAKAKLSGVDIFSDKWLDKEKELREKIEEVLYTPTFVNVTHNQVINGPAGGAQAVTEVTDTELKQVTRKTLPFKPIMTPQWLDLAFGNRERVPVREIEGLLKATKRGVSKGEFADSGLAELVERHTDKSMRHGGMVSLEEIKATVAAHQQQPMVVVQDGEDAEYTELFLDDFNSDSQKAENRFWKLLRERETLRENMNAAFSAIYEKMGLPVERYEGGGVRDPMFSLRRTGRDEELRQANGELGADAIRAELARIDVEIATARTDRDETRDGEDALRNERSFREILVFAPGMPRLQTSELHFTDSVKREIKESGVQQQHVSDMSVMDKEINGKKYLYLLEQQSDLHQALSKKPEATALSALVQDQEDSRETHGDFRFTKEAERIVRGFFPDMERWRGSVLTEAIEAVRRRFKDSGLETVKLAQEILSTLEWASSVDPKSGPLSPHRHGDKIETEEEFNLAKVKLDGYRASHPEIFEAVGEIFVKNAELYEALDKAEANRRRENIRRGNALIPFQHSWIDLSMKALIDHAASNGYDGIILASGEAVATRWHGDSKNWTKKDKKKKGEGEEKKGTGFKSAVQGKLDHYNQKLPNSLLKNLRKAGVTPITSVLPVGIDPAARLFEFSEADRQAINGTTQRLYQAQPTRQANAAAIAAAAQQVAAAFNNLDQATWQEIVADIRKAGMLSGLRTHFGNVISNTAFQIVEEAARYPASSVDMLLRLRYGQRSISASATDNIKAIAHAFSLEKGSGELHEQGGLRRFVDELWGVSSNSANSQTSSSSFGWNRDSKILKGIETVTSAVFKALQAEDAIFHSYAMRRNLLDLARVAVLNGEAASQQAFMANLTEADIDTAFADALIATFNNNNSLSTGMSNLKTSLSEHGGLGANTKLAIELIVPFDRTPTNIIGRMFDYTPLGLLLGSGGRHEKQMTLSSGGHVPSSLIKKIKVLEGMRKEKLLGANVSDRDIRTVQREASKQISRGSVGTIILMGAVLGRLGVIMGLGDDDDRDRNEATGAQKGAMLIGDSWISLNRMQPIGSLLVFGATIQQSLERRDTGGGVVSDVGMAALKQLMQIPTLRGFGEFSTSMQDENRAEAFAGRMLASFIPTVIKDIADAADPLQRDTRNQNAFGLLPVGPAMSAIPGLRESLPVRRDFLGRDLPPNHWAQAFFDPFNTSPSTGSGLDKEQAKAAKDDPVFRELSRLDVTINKPRQLAGETDEEYAQRLRVLGTASYRAVEREIAKQAYKDAAGLRARSGKVKQREWLEDRIGAAKAEAATKLKKWKEAQNGKPPEKEAEFPWEVEKKEKKGGGKPRKPSAKSMMDKDQLEKPEGFDPT